MKTKPAQTIPQQKKKFVSDLFGFLSIALTLLFINYMTGGYWWAFWPIGFYGISIVVSFLNLVKNIYLEELNQDEEFYLPEGFHENDDVLDLDELSEEKAADRKRNWNDRDFV